MFNCLHHRTWFPFIVAVLSLVLALFVFWALIIKPPSVIVNESPVITMGQYQTAAKLALGDFQNRYEAETYWETRLALVTEAEQNLLALRVPAEAQAIHFELVSAMELLKQGLAGQTEKLEEGQARLDKVFSENPWLAQ